MVHDDERAIAALIWVAGPQRFADSPDAADLGAVRRRGWAHDLDGRIALTREGKRVLDGVAVAEMTKPRR